MKKKYIILVLPLFFLLGHNCKIEECFGEENVLIEYDSVFAGQINDNSNFYYKLYDYVISIPTSEMEFDEEGSIDLDVNYDEISDLRFSWYEEFWRGFDLDFRVETISDDFYIAAEDSVDYPSVFNLGDLLDCRLNFQSGDFLLVSESAYEDKWTDEITYSSSGIWIGIDEHYIAYKFKRLEEWNIGWLKIGFVGEGTATSMKIYEFGYEKDYNCN